MMKSLKSLIAVAELLLILPALLFMTALFVRNIQPQQYEPARTAEQIVTWYAERPRLGLWVLLIALPFAVLAIGCGTLLRSWLSDVELQTATRQTITAFRRHLATVLVATATLAACAILAIVAVHVLTD